MTRNRWLMTGLTVLVGLVVAAILSELMLRTVHRLRDGTPFFTTLPGYRETRFQRSPFLVFGPRINWSFQRSGDPDWTRFNERGIRLPDSVPPREPGEIRVLALGGSTTEDFWNELGIHWSLGLECLLRADGRNDVRVLNAGMSAYSTAHSLVRYQFDLVETEPDVVLIMHNINDLLVNYHAAAAGREIDPNYLVKYGTKGYTGSVDASDVILSRVGHSIRLRLWPLRSSYLPSAEWKYDLERGAQIFQRNLRLLIASVRQSGAIPVLLTMPRSNDPTWLERMRNSPAEGIGIVLLPEMARFTHDFDRYNDAIREVGAAEGAAVLDMARAVGDGPDVFVDIVHYSTNGVRVFAKALHAQSARFIPHGSGAVLTERSKVRCEGVF